MSVVGFDLGNESCVIAVARRRVIDVLQNDVGKRKTRSIVAYGEHQRFIGDEASSQFSSNIKSSLVYFRNFLGKASNDPDVDLEMKHVAYETIDVDGRIGFKVKHLGEEVILPPEQVTAAMLTKLKALAESGLEGQTVSDCVIGCPNSWREAQRRALLDAAKLAGLNVLRLMNETTAVALNYGILRPLPEKEERKVLFVDMGLSQTQCAVVTFQKGKLKVLSATSAKVGGRDMDLKLMDHFANYIVDKYKMDVRTNAKAIVKLQKECQKVKLVLSANNKVPFNVEYIMNDRDVTGAIQREEYEAMLDGVIGDFLNCVKETLDKANCSPADVLSCEIVGGATRVPILQKKLEEFIGKPLSKTCDSDESVARGCALMCAMLSPSFKVRDFEVQDINMHPIEVAWDEASEDTLMFDAGCSFPSVKMISFKDRTEPFDLTIRYQNAPKGVNPVLGVYQVSGMPPADPSAPVPKIKVKVKMNIHGIVNCSGAQIHKVVEEEDTEMKTEESTGSGDAPAAAANGDAPAADAGAEKPAEEMDTSAEASAEKKEEAPAAPVERKKKVKKVDLTVTGGATSGFNTDEMKKATESEAAMSMQDKVVAETNKARNDLESYVLEMRSAVESDLSKYIKEGEGAAFCKRMTELEDWLYEDGEDAQKSEYKEKLKILKVTGDPVERRANEARGRPEAVANLKKEIGGWENSSKTEDEKYSHITVEERAEVVKNCQETDAWLIEELGKQDALPTWEDPTLTLKDIETKRQDLWKKCSKIMNRAKPAPPKPEPEEKKGDETASTDTPAEGEAAAPAANGGAEEAKADAAPMDTHPDMD